MKKRMVAGRKLLVASIGVASVLYGCEKREAHPPGNLVAPPPDTVVTSGNLMAPQPVDAAPPVPEAKTPEPAKDAGPIQIVTSGNLMAPPPKPSAGPKHPPGNLMPPPPPPSDVKPKK